MAIEGGADIKRAKALIAEAARALAGAERLASEHKNRAHGLLGEVRRKSRKSLH